MFLNQKRNSKDSFPLSIFSTQCLKSEEVLCPITAYCCLLLQSQGFHVSLHRFACSLASESCWPLNIVVTSSPFRNLRKGIDKELQGVTSSSVHHGRPEQLPKFWGQEEDNEFSQIQAVYCTHDSW